MLGAVVAQRRSAESFRRDFQFGALKSWIAS
jgi:hypothetical protein